ncbi:MAG: sulfatase, partial [Actinomycetota bacterium]
MQLIDLTVTLLESFGLQATERMQGKSIRPAFERDCTVRDEALFGMHGAQINYTDGHYVYMRSPRSAENRPLFNYTLMPTHMWRRFTVEELRSAELRPPFG